MTPMRRVLREWRLVLAAVEFLTRLPVPAGVGCEPDAMRRAVRHFPLVGALVGAFGAALALAANAFWPPGVAAAFAVAGTLWLTAAFHEDGLADTFDALLGAASREKALAIMKDSRIGTYGAAALVLVLGLRVTLLAELLGRDVAGALAALVASHAAGRGAAVMLMASLPYARDAARDLARDGLRDDARHAADLPPATAGSLARDVCASDAAWAAAVAIAALALAASMQPAPVLTLVCALLAIAGLLLAMRRGLRRRIAGYTGDSLGAAEQFGEVLVLLVFAAQWTR